MRLLNQTSGRLLAPLAGSCPPLCATVLRVGRPGPMKAQALSCRDNRKHTCTQRKGPTVREDHLHLWLDKEWCRSTRWNALLPFRRIQPQSVYTACDHPTLIIIHDAPFTEFILTPRTQCFGKRVWVFSREARDHCYKTTPRSKK